MKSLAIQILQRLSTMVWHEKEKGKIPGRQVSRNITNRSMQVLHFEDKFEITKNAKNWTNNYEIGKMIL